MKADLTITANFIIKNAECKNDSVGEINDQVTRSIDAAMRMLALMMRGNVVEGKVDVTIEVDPDNLSITSSIGNREVN